MTRRCFIPGCDTGIKNQSRELGRKRPTLFSTPKDPKTFKKWQKVLSFIGKPLKKTDRLCEFHFKEDDISRCYEKIILFDGTEFCMEKALFHLKKGAYPTIFWDYLPEVDETKSTISEILPQKRKIDIEISDSEETETSDSVIENTQNADNSLNSHETSNVSTSSTTNFIHPHSIEKTSTDKLQSFVVPSTNLPSTKGKQNVLLLTTPQNKQNFVKTPLLLANIVNDKHSFQGRQNIDNKCAGIVISSKDQQSVSGPQANRENSSRPNISGPPILVTTVPQNRINVEQSKQVLSTNNKCQLSKKKPPMILEICRTENQKHRAILPKNNQNNPQSSTLPETNPKNLSDVVSLGALLQDPTSKVYQVFFNKMGSSNSEPDSNRDKTVTYSKPSPVIEKVFSRFGTVQNVPPSTSHVPDSMDDSPEPLSSEEFSLNFLKLNLSKINTCSSWWKVNDFNNSIICCRFTPDYRVERRIIIEEELSVKVFLKEILTPIGKDMKVDSIDAVSKLIYRVEKSIFCSRIDEKNPRCEGFLQGVVVCKRKNLCLGCVHLDKEREFEVKQRQKEEKNFEEHVELLRFHFKI